MGNQLDKELILRMDNHMHDMLARCREKLETAKTPWFKKVIYKFRLRKMERRYKYFRFSIEFAAFIISIDQLSQEEKPQAIQDSEDDKYWYLRDGDFLPEPISSMRGLTERFMEEMRGLGNLFPTKEQAAKASEEVRELLRSKYGKCP